MLSLSWTYIISRYWASGFSFWLLQSHKDFEEEIVGFFFKYFFSFRIVPQTAVYSYFPPSQPEYINPAAAARMNIGYNQNPMLMQAAAAAAPPAPPTTVAAGAAGSVQQQQQLQQQLQMTKAKRILSIVDPLTKEVTNKEDIIRSELEQQQLQHNVENTDGGKFGSMCIFVFKMDNVWARVYLLRHLICALACHLPWSAKTIQISVSPFGE